MYAQTTVQLFAQLRREGYSLADQHRILASYDLATELFSGYFTATGRTQIAHVVGTASIVCALHVPAAVVAGALIHNVYETGDFGDGRRGVSAARRRQIRDAVGADIEAYPWRFAALRGAAAPVFSDLVGQLDREVLLIIVADWLDHRLNVENSPRHGVGMADAAERLGFSTLAGEVRHAATVRDELEIDLTLRRPSAGTTVPRSYRRRLKVVLRPRVSNGLHRVLERVVPRRRVRRPS